MPLHEQNYEIALIKELPPNAQDVALHLFATHPLDWFFIQMQTPQIDDYIMKDKKVSHKFWPEIIQAATLAKLTYIQPNAGFNAQQLKFLLSKACEIIGRPLNHYSIKSTMLEMSSSMPRFSHWLKQVVLEYKKLNN